MIYKLGGFVLAILFVFGLIGCVRRRQSNPLVLLIATTCMFILCSVYVMSLCYPKIEVLLCLFISYLLSLVYVVNSACREMRWSKAVLMFSGLCILLCYTGKNISAQRSYLGQNKEKAVFEDMVKGLPQQKMLMLLGVPTIFDAFHTSDNVVAQKLVRSGWSTNIPHNNTLYTGFTSFTDDHLPICISRDEPETVEMIQEVLRLRYHQPTQVKVLCENPNYRIIELVKERFDE